MRACAATLVTAVLCIGCSKSPMAPVAPVDFNRQAQTAVPAVEPARPPEISPPAVEMAYPEKSEVAAILHRALELQQKLQYVGALQLVSQALEIDPHSPAAQSMRRRLEEILKKV